ncbi:Hsp20/alpha crystallin family protein [Oesophagostomum dentatum]|uniref:Hsp20/alpha crystallin family protein n=1 Tax=Oesophagostomum dentatum TaxID=61180 RepID=A0A0B1T8N9_OESDE|nr:Hsp20/alpha crystallin family protein [Oesophagostomum dentatum]
MSICLLPTSTIFPNLHWYDDLFDELDSMERILRPSRMLVPKEERGTMEKVTDDESKLLFTLDVSQFKPEELKVNLEGRTLIVEGQQETKDEQSYSMTSFSRHWLLPKNVDIEQIRPSLTSKGNLVIEAPEIVKSAITTREIPITKTEDKEEPAKSA